MAILTRATLGSIKFRSMVLIFFFVILALLFVSPPVTYTQEAQDRNANMPQNSRASELKLTELIQIEYQKAIDEIKTHLQQQDSWYHYKFLILGGVLAIFLGQTGFARDRSYTSADDARRLKKILTADSNYAILVLACIISLIIDMHIRSNMFEMQTIGLWIANYVEPQYPTSGYYPWEQFIRHINSPDMHLDSLYRLSFTIHLHFLTTIIYLIYAIVLQQICLSFGKTEGQNNKTEGQDNKPNMERRRRVIVFGFLLIHLSMLSFVFVSHSVPSAYMMKLIPFNRYESGWKMVGYYLIPWVLIIAINMPYLLLIRQKKISRLQRAAA